MDRQVLVIARLGEFQRQACLAARADGECGAVEACPDSVHDETRLGFPLSLRPDMQRDELIIVVVAAGFEIEGAGAAVGHVGKGRLVARLLEQAGAAQERRKRRVGLQPQEQGLHQIARRRHLSIVSVRLTRPEQNPSPFSRAP